VVKIQRKPSNWIFSGTRNNTELREERGCRLAKIDGVSLNQFIAATAAEKVRALRTASEFLQQRAGSAKPKDLIKYLRRAPKVDPVKGDERD
jgi:hypothetical protein